MTKKIFLYSIDILFLLAYCFLFIVFLRGFFYVDPFFIDRFPVVNKAILLIVRIIVVILGSFILYLYFNIRRKKLKLKEFGLLLIVVSFLFISAYLISGFLYGFYITRSNEKNFHPYLQLTPNEFIPDKYPDGEHISVMCIGGSTTEWKDSNKKGWPERVETKLKESLNRSDISVYNQGRQWYTTLHTLINYEVNLRHHKPDIIVVMHAVNDLLHNADFSSFSKGDFREDYGHFYGPVKRIIKRPHFNAFLYQKFRSIWYHEKREIITTDTFPGLVSFKRNLNTLIDLAEKDSVTIILMTQPSLYRKDYDSKILPYLKMLNMEAHGEKGRWSYETALNGFIQYNNLIREISFERNVPLIDLEKEVPKTLEYFLDDVHYSDPSFDLVAKAVTEGILKNSLFPEVE